MFLVSSLQVLSGSSCYISVCSGESSFNESNGSKSHESMSHFTALIGKRLKTYTNKMIDIEKHAVKSLFVLTIRCNHRHKGNCKK